MEQKKEITPITDQQMESLREFIRRAKDGSEFAKQALLWLLEQTDNLTKPVLLLFDNRCIEGRGVARGVHDMVSSEGITHLGNFIQGLSTPMKISSINSDREISIRIGINCLGLDSGTKVIYVNSELSDQMIAVVKASTIKNIRTCSVCNIGFGDNEIKGENDE